MCLRRHGDSSPTRNGCARLQHVTSQVQVCAHHYVANSDVTPSTGRIIPRSDFFTIERWFRARSANEESRTQLGHSLGQAHPRER